MVGHKVMWLPECTAAPSPQKKPPLGSPVKIVFQRLLFDNNSHSVYIMTFHIIMLFRNSCQMPFHKLIPPLPSSERGWGFQKYAINYLCISMNHSVHIRIRSIEPFHKSCQTQFRKIIPPFTVTA